MKIAVFSDSHGYMDPMVAAVEEERPDHIFFLGDNLRDGRQLQRLYPDIPMSLLRGNCDFGSKLKTVDTVEMGRAKVLFCHGHTMMVGSGTGLLEQAAREQGCNIALFGHTHISVCRYQDGLYLMNPGSPAQPRDGRKSYGIIDITDTGILPYIVKLDP